MAAIDFPNSPTVNDVFTVGDRSWKWNGSTWSANNITLLVSAASFSPTAPSSPVVGQFWYDTYWAKLLMWNGSTWFEVTI